MLPNSLAEKVTNELACKNFDQMTSCSVHHITVLPFRSKRLIHREVPELSSHRLGRIRLFGKHTKASIVMTAEISKVEQHSN